MIPAPIADLLGDVTVVEVLIWVAGGVALLTVAYKSWPVVKRGVRLIDTLADLPESLAAIRRQVENDHPADPNLREELTQVREIVEEVREKQQEHGAQLDDLAGWKHAHEATSAAVVARVARTEDRLERIEKSP